MKLKVNINDKASKIDDILKKEKISGCLIFKNKLVDREKIFREAGIQDQEKMAYCVGGTGGRMEGKKWQRYKNLYYDNGIDMRWRDNEFDQIVFVPKKDIVFLGFGMMANHAGKDMIFQCKWKIDGEESETFTVEKPDAEKDSDKKWHTIHIQDLGVEPIKVGPDKRISLYCRVTAQDMARCFDGMEGTQAYYSVMPDQDYDFEVHA